MVLFTLLIGIVCVQRLIELVIARRNEKWMKSNGAREEAPGHYPLIVLLHVTFFISLVGEVILLERTVSSWWQLWLVIFLLAQVGRIWSLCSLGKFWNTKIIILPGAKLVKKGPYRWIKHPNYVIVAIELLVLPILFQAYYTAIIFSVLNAFLILLVRIPAEEKALTRLQK